MRLRIAPAEQADEQAADIEAAALEQLSPLPGRGEDARAGEAAQIFVDPDAVEHQRARREDADGGEALHPIGEGDHRFLGRARIARRRLIGERLRRPPGGRMRIGRAACKRRDIDLECPDDAAVSVERGRSEADHRIARRIGSIELDVGDEIDR